MTIREAVERFIGGEVLVPTLRGRFRWRPRQIERLFDDILRGLSPDPFFFWSPGDFGTNLEYYDADPNVHEERILFESQSKRLCPPGTRPRWAVLDGAQHLFALCIGLKGSLNYRRPFGYYSEGECRVRELYLRLCGSSFPEDGEPSPDEAKRDGLFIFLSEEEYGEQSRAGNVWVPAKRILAEEPGAIVRSLPVPSADRAEALARLNAFSDAIGRERNIRFTVVEGVPPEDVLDSYFRSLIEKTLSGDSYQGEKCEEESFFALAAQRWREYNPREEIKLLKAEIDRLGASRFPENGRRGFYLNTGFILIICRYLIDLTDETPRFEFRRFLRLIADIGEEWAKIKRSVVAAYGVYARCGWSLGMRDTALLPVIYWIYKNGKTVLSNGDLFRLWSWNALFVIMDGFGGTPPDYEPDYELAFKLRKAVDSAEGAAFPLKELCGVLKDEYPYGLSRDGAHDLSFDEYLDILLHEPCHSERSRAVLLLLRLYAFRDAPDFAGVLSGGWRQIHLHPAERFPDPDELNEIFHNAEDVRFASDASNWDSVLNQWLEPAQGEKLADAEKPLAEWAAENGVSRRELFLDNGVSLDVRDFRAFVENRKKNITAILRDMLQ